MLADKKTKEEVIKQCQELMKKDRSFAPYINYLDWNPTPGANNIQYYNYEDGYAVIWVAIKY